MNIRWRAESRLAGYAKVEEYRAGISRGNAVGSCQFHEEVVRMLAVNQRRATVRRFARLQQERIPPDADGERLRRERSPKAKPARPAGREPRNIKWFALNVS